MWLVKQLKKRLGGDSNFVMATVLWSVVSTIVWFAYAKVIGMSFQQIVANGAFGTVWQVIQAPALLLMLRLVRLLRGGLMP
jgi:hypothetical protein